MLVDSLAKNNHKDKYINMFVSIVFILVIVGILVLVQIISTQLKSSEKIVAEVSQQLSFNIYNRITGDLQVLEMIASSISDTPQFKPQDLKSYLKTGKRQSAFQTLSFVDLNGKSYTINRENSLIEVSNKQNAPCFDKARSGEMCFYRNIATTDILNNSKNVYAVPIKKNNKTIAVLYSQARADIFKNILDINTFNGVASSNIIKSNGDYIFRTNNIAFDNNQNFFEQSQNIITSKKSRVKKNINDLKSGCFWTIVNGQLWVASYTPISFNDWLILLYVPAKVLALSVIEIVFFTIGLMLAINCLLFLTLKRVETLQKSAYEKMMDIAFLDEVTKGYNKAKFIIEAQNILKNMTSDEKRALILVDIAKFKVINELYGFDLANVILKDVYEIIKKNLPEGSLFTRSYAATYMFIIKYDKNEDINFIVDTIHKEIDEYNNTKMGDIKTLNKAVAKLVTRFGVYLINDTTVPIYMMCDRVGLAKRTIVNDVNKYISYYDDNLRKQLLSEKNIEDEMYEALANEQFVMYLQPKYDMKTFCVAGSEALVRWIHPTKGFMPPGEFIPLFEKNGFVLNIDRYIWEQACKAIRSWIDKGYSLVPISVNVSRLHLSNEFFIQDLKNLIDKYQIPTNLLELELTESAGFEDFDKFISIVNELKALGFSIAMDDFGSGYSSLNMLRQIPCDILKLDKGFINTSTTDERGKIVVQHILSMAKNLSIKTVSEGIETVDQARFLADSGCDIAQGFLYAKPMPLNDFEKIAFPEQTELKIQGLNV